MRSLVSLLTVAIIWLALLLGCADSNNRSSSSNSTTNSQPAGAGPSVETIDYALLEVVKSKWETGGFDTIGIWKVTFRNKSTKLIGNIKYRTAYYAETGDVVDKGGVDSLISKDTIQKVIKPGETRTIEINDGFINSESHTARFEVVSWEYINTPK